MGTLSVFHWLLLLSCIVLMAVLFWKIFPFAGRPSVLTLLMPAAPIHFMPPWRPGFQTLAGGRPT